MSIVESRHPERAQKRLRGKRQSIPFADRVTCSVRDAVEATSISRSRLYELMAQGRIEFRLQGRHRVIVVASLIRMLDIEREPEST